jgi:hypothetical protein
MRFDEESELVSQGPYLDNRKMSTLVLENPSRSAHRMVSCVGEGTTPYVPRQAQEKTTATAELLQSLILQGQLL